MHATGLQFFKSPKLISVATKGIRVFPEYAVLQADGLAHHKSASAWLLKMPPAVPLWRLSFTLLRR